MKAVGARYFLVGALAVLGLSIAAQANPTIVLGNNIGTLREQVTVGSNTSFFDNENIPTPYGASPFPIITTNADTTTLIFSPTSAFQVDVVNAVGTDTKTFNGDLSFLVTFDSPIHLTTTVSEQGSYTAGNGVTSVSGLITVTDPYSGDSRKTPFSDNLVGSGTTWQLTPMVTGFTTAHSTYLISIDNLLTAQATNSSASVDKKEFIITLTTDGGGVPEPASLGILAVGSLALMARRRRA
jgi:hypothetical protein